MLLLLSVLHVCMGLCIDRFLDRYMLVRGGSPDPRLPALSGVPGRHRHGYAGVKICCWRD